MSTHNHILLVEDDKATAEMTSFYLSNDGYRVTIIDDGASALNQFDAIKPDLCIFDIMLPGLDGIELCKQIRSQSAVPILMLTARVSDVDKTLAFGLGADDYLVKPFSHTELVSRVRAMLRRAYELNNPIPEMSKVLGGPDLQLDVNRHLVTYKGVRRELTKVEFALLQKLMESPGWVVTRAQLLHRVWPNGEEAVEDTVTVHVSNLRKNLGSEAGKLIQTVRGVGYTYKEE